VIGIRLTNVQWFNIEKYWEKLNLRSKKQSLKGKTQQGTYTVLDASACY